MRHRTLYIIAILFFIFTMPITSLAKEQVKVTIEGVSAELRENIFAFLRLYLYKDSTRLQEKNIMLLYNESDGDIQKALAPFGYYDPVIGSSIAKEDGSWHARYDIDPGTPITISKVHVDIEGEGRDLPVLVRALANNPIKVGDVLLQPLYKKYKQQLLRLAFEEGFLDAKFTEHRLGIYKKRHRAQVHLVLTLGPRYRFGSLQVEQDGINSDLFNRYVAYQRGDPYRSVELYSLQESLYRSGYFRNVVVQGETKKAVDGEVPIVIRAESIENRNKYTIGLGYASDTGVRTTLGWYNRQLNKKGHKLRVALQLGERDSSLVSSYEIPVFDPRYEKIATSAAYLDQDWNNTKTKVFTFGPTYVYSANREKYSLGLEYRNEDYSIGSTSGTSSLLVPNMSYSYIFSEKKIASSQSTQLKKGVMVTANLRASTGGFGSDSAFLQEEVRTVAALSPWKRWRVIGRLTLGATQINSIDDLPPSLRFYAGGDTSVRGYGYRDIGTKDSNGNVIGGLYTTVLSVELERSINDYIAAAAFWDMGSATEEFTPDFYQGTGMGLRVNLPFGQVRLDVGVPLTENDGFSPRLHFSVTGEF